MKVLLLILVCALAASAQNTQVPKVTLSGTPSQPVLVNHSGKQVIAAMVIQTLPDGTHQVSQHLFTNKANQLPDGGTEPVGRSLKQQQRTGIAVESKITAVIFADGEFRGEDSYSFQANIETHLQSMRRSWQMAKAGNWDGVKAEADAANPSNADPISNLDSIFGVAIAKKLLAARAAYGDTKAVDSMAWIANLPSNTWKSGLINQLSIPNIFQALAPALQQFDYQTFC